MTTKPQVYSQFTVTSRCLCYGALHNIWHGASSPIQEFPTAIDRRTGGTVTSQVLEFNVTAKNGTWNAFQLVERGTDHVCGWFVSHSEVDPEVEIDKILRVSGSPYEPDSGSSFNDDKTAAEAVLVINRYDWGYYDSRAKEDIAIGDEAYDDTTRMLGCEAAGLVDFGSAKAEVLRWQEKKSLERDNPPGGVWMHIPSGEYMFGRFGFDEARTAAKSFIFFTTNTYFARTTFVGLDRTLRLEETDEERFQRYLREGRNFEGLDTLERQITSWQWSSHLPAESEYLGPYDSHEHLLKNTDIDAIRIRPRVKANEFADPLKELCYTCLNEMIMSYLEHFIAPASSCNTVVATAASLFPKCSNSNTLMYSFMMEPHSDPIRGYDNRAVGSKIKSFLTPRCEDNSLVKDDKFIAGICACIAYLLSEVLELANNCGRNSGRSKIVPVDIRLAVFNDVELRGLFKYSKVFWKGSG